MPEETAGRFVQYGCGLSAPEGWANYDVSPTLRLQRIPLIGALARRRVRFPPNVRYGDVVRGLPVPDGSCDAVYCSHMLEHLPYNGLRTALRNTFRILKPGGVFRLVLPDLQVLVEEYLRFDPATRASNLMRRTNLGSLERPMGLIGRLRASFGNSAHLWMWDYPGLEHELLAAQFIEIRRAQFGDSSLAAFAEVEDAARFEEALAIECRRPA